MNRNTFALSAAAVVLAAAMVGCSGAQTASSTAPAASSAASEAASEAASAPAAETKTYTSADGWELDYNPALFACNENDGEVDFVYQGECAGSTMVAFSYTPGKMPTEVLYDKTSSYEPEQVQRTEGNFAGADDAWSRTYTILPTQEGGSGLVDSFIGIEHNGGTLLVEVLTHMGEDEAQNFEVSDQLVELVNTFRWTNHEPQQEFSYIPGTYTRDYTEELDGKENTVTETITLNPDHTGTMKMQDSCSLYWGSTELETASEKYEYTVEGDNLYVKLNPDSDDFTEFHKDKAA